MQIKIKDKFKIISHDIGSIFLIMNTSYYVKIYPGLLSFKDLDSNKTFNIYLKFQGPVKNFTIVQNLFNGNIEVFFHIKDGYVSYSILTSEESTYLYFDRITTDKFKIEFNEELKISPKENIKLPINVISNSKPKEYLSFGIYKKPDIYFIKKRENLNEIFPFIFLYSQFYLDAQYNCCLRKNCLLKEIDKAIQIKEKQNLSETFLNVFKVHFFGSFIPRMNDEEYQNIISNIDKDFSPWCIFIRLYHSIKAMFIEETSNELFLLPCLIPDFNHGRALNLKISKGSIDLEWSKKLLKKVIFIPSCDCSFKIILQSQIKTFRIRENKNEKGKIFNNFDDIYFQKDKVYFLDKFKK